MAMGKPVIASDCGGNSELVIDGVTGLLIRNNDAEKLTDAITELLADGVRCAQMAQEARRRIENEFSLERMIQSYTRLYLDVAANRT
jgi:glycosyltransferase involved in cell wall biosynthesis